MSIMNKYWKTELLKRPNVERLLNVEWLNLEWLNVERQNVWKDPTYKDQTKIFSETVYGKNKNIFK
jgi:hypothetical protein